MDPKTMAHGCPNRVQTRDSWSCKALLGQPNNVACDPSNCAALYIADLMINDLRTEMYGMFENLAGQGGKHEDHESAATIAAGDES